MQQVTESSAPAPLNVVALRFVHGHAATLAGSPAISRPETFRPVQPVGPALGERAMRGLTESRAEDGPRIIPQRRQRGGAVIEANDPRPATLQPPAADPEERHGERDASGLTEEQRRAIGELAKRDQEVRAHEQAHAIAGGQYAGAPKYVYQTGPDGRRYAVGGEVPIDISPVQGDPEATIRKMQQVKAAALAPAEPSGADRRVAALAESQRLRAIAELARQDAEQRREALTAREAGAGSDDPLQRAEALTPPSNPREDLGRLADILSFVPGTGEPRWLDHAA